MLAYGRPRYPIRAALRRFDLDGAGERSAAELCFADLDPSYPERAARMESGHTPGKIPRKIRPEDPSQVLGSLSSRPGGRSDPLCANVA